MRALAVASVFLSAVLAFSVEPLTAKRLLPAFGGTAAVWVTCLVAFQGLLLLGYLYAHAVARLGRVPQAAVHLAALALSFAVFPWSDPVPPPAGAEPAGRLIVELLRTSALPFFVLSTNATLLQHWFTRRTGEAPWFLYAVSNAGSLIGLLAYPLVLEPVFGLRAQSAGWRVGYAIFAGLTVVALVLGAGPRRETDAGPAPPRSQVLRWFVRSALGAMLLTATSYWITVDVAALPLLWVLPLAVYLVTFVLAFSPRVPFPRETLAVFCMLPILFGLLNTTTDTYSAKVLLGSALGALFLGGWVVHGDLARDRPEAGRLTAYYLWIAAGGFAGGLLGNVLPPLVFDSIAEYPIALAALALALAVEKDTAALRATLRLPSTWALVVGAAVLLTAVAAYDRGVGPLVLIAIISLLLPGVVTVRVRAGLFGIAAAVIAAFLATGVLQGRELTASRSFYGVLRVEVIDGVPWMRHGTTLHGVGRLSPDEPPGAYYHPAGPLGARVRAQRAGARIGIVGLGTGALAALCSSGQHVTFFEIDPGVLPIASEHFDYLETSPANVGHVLGDARLTVAEVPDGTFDLLVVDAFSSDAIPAHLLTREGMAVWLRKIKPDGEVVLHISNRNFWLLPVVKGAVAHRPEVKGYRFVFVPTRKEDEERAALTLAAALTLDREKGIELVAEGWRGMDDVEPMTWTDDHTSVVSALEVLRRK